MVAPSAQYSSTLRVEIDHRVAEAVAAEARRAGADRGGSTIGFAAIDAERLHAQG